MNRTRWRTKGRYTRLGTSSGHPPGCQKLSSSGKYRVRQGSYRIVYPIEDDQLVVTIIRVAHRSDVYRERD
ncbi:MAG: type II toxin-antitoxin system RelE/ParE family toxin [Candidatus Binatia bacterium]